MDQLPFGFSQDLVDQYRKNLDRPIEEQGAQDVGKARSEALARGLSGDPFESSLTGAARQGTQAQLAGVNSDLAWKMAGLTHGDAQQQKGWDFQAGQNDQDRALSRERMQMERDQANAAEQGGLFSGLGSIAGGILGGPIGAGIGKSLGGVASGLFKKRAATPEGSSVPYYLADQNNSRSTPWAPPSWG